MHIVHVIKTSIGATWALRQIRELIYLGNKVDVILPEDGPIVELYREVGAKVHFAANDVAALKNPIRLIRSAYRLRRMIGAIAPDIIHTHFVGCALMLRLAMYGDNTPRLFQVPGVLHLENPLIKSVEIALTTRNDFWVASCKATREIYLRSGVKPERVGLSYYGTDLVTADKDTPLDLRAQLGLKADTTIIGMVAYAYAPKQWLGYRRGIKGHEDLIDAAALLRDAGWDVTIVIVGGPWGDAAPYYEQVQAYARERLGQHAYFLGTRQDVHQIYSNFDVVAHPSHSENLGGAVESLLLGVPTVTTNVGGFPDIVLPGKTGWLVEAKNPQALAMAIEEALVDPIQAKALAAAGRMMMIQLLDVRTTAAEIQAIYRSLLKNKDICPASVKATQTENCRG